MDNNATTPSTLDQALVNIINKTTAGIDSATTFLSEQIPDVVQQLLLWHFTYNLVLFISGVVLLIVTGVVLYKYGGKGRELTQEERRYSKYVSTITHDEDGNAGPQLLATGFVTFAILMVSSTLINLTWLKIWLAPKIFLIEYTATLIKG